MVGIDEAGRGAVLGSMFYGLVAVSQSAVLGKYDVRDSKVLSDAERSARRTLLAADPEVTWCTQ